MNLDKLISKYIDGELSRAEDKELRKVLRKDIAAKQTFDAHVLIHAAFKEDASNIVPSDKLVSKTEDIILAKILAKQPFVGDTLPEKKSRKVFAYLSLVVVVLLAAVISISELSIKKHENGIAVALRNDRIKLLRSNETKINEAGAVPENLVMFLPKENSTEKTNGTTTVSKNLLASTGSTSQSNSSFAASIYSSSAENSSLRNDIVGTLKENNVKMSDIVFSDRISKSADDNTLNEDFLNKISYNDEVNPVETVSTANFQLNNNYTDEGHRTQLNKNRILPDISNILGNSNENYFYGKRSEVQLNTFLGSGVLQTGYGGKTPKIVSDFSQSISYKVSPKQHIGIDFGLTKYSYDQTKNVTLPGIAPYSSGSKGKAGIEIRGTGPGFLNFPITINIQQQMFWGAAFFDQCIFSTDKFTLNGRLALGATSEGSLGYMRVYAKYRMFRWFSINAGADGRIFKWDEPAFGIEASPFKSSLSIIYGLEINI